MSNPLNLHPIDWYNFYGSFDKIFDGIKVNFITPTEAGLISDDPNKATFIHNGTTIEVVRANKYYPIGIVSKFMLFTAIQFKGDQAHAISYIQYDLMGVPIPYIRVKCDYYKVIQKEDRYTGIQTNLVPWKKEEIKQDHAKFILSSIPKFDDFVIIPDNKSYQPIVKNCYNLYSKFPHAPFHAPVTDSDIHVTLSLLNHVFGNTDGRRNQVPQALIYYKVLYEYPKQILPVLCLVSRPRNTGKTTVINWMDMMFGNNFIQVAPEELTDKFNSDFGIKNIIAADEAFMEKGHSVEKIKSLSTAKKINISEKFISKYSIPFYGKIILSTNKVADFMRIESEENRFWIRRLPLIDGKKNIHIEEDLFNEIPKFLKYLEQLPAINFDNGERMVLSKEQTETEDLAIVVKESRSGLYKELEIHIQDYFHEYEYEKSLFATATDIKKRWFLSNNQVSIAYIRKVIKEEMNLQALPFQRYNPFESSGSIESRPGTPFEFPNPNPKIPPENIPVSQNGIYSSESDILPF